MTGGWRDSITYDAYEDIDQKWWEKDVSKKHKKFKGKKELAVVDHKANVKPPVFCLSLIHI